MTKMQFFGVVGFLLYFCCYVCATLTIKQINGPSSIEDGSMDDLVLDCEFEAEGEEEVVLKWFFNGLEQQIYQWITTSDQAYASGPMKDLIDTSYKLGALKFNDVGPELSGNYTCKISSDDHDAYTTKQVIVYSPASSFNMYFIGGDDDFRGNEVVLCDVQDVSPKPNLNIHVGTNSSVEDLPETFVLNKQEISDNGFYNVSITLSFNASYLEKGTTQFECQLSIPGTNYSETKSVEHDEHSGNIYLRSSLPSVLFLLISLLVAT